MNKVEIPRLHLGVLDSSAFQMRRLSLLSLQKDVTPDRARMAGWCLAFQFMLVGSSSCKGWHFLGMPPAPSPRKWTRKINCSSNSTGLVNPNQREAGWQSSLLLHGRSVSGERRCRWCLPFPSVLQGSHMCWFKINRVPLSLIDSSDRQWWIPPMTPPHLTGYGVWHTLVLP